MSARPPSTLQPAVAEVRSRAASLRHPLVLIDGPSGAGKTTFAEALVAAWPGRPPVVVRVDGAIPGWRGLDHGSARLARTLVAPLARGSVGSILNWDWIEDRAGARRRLPPGRPLVIEGCGAFRAGVRHPEAIRVWLDAPYADRRKRALERDRGAFDPHWEAWERDWRRHVTRTRSDRAPAIRVRLAG